MTLPDERFRAVIQTKNFLAELADPSKTPRIPKSIRQQAVWCLRHYPSYWDLERVSAVAPDVFAPTIEDVQRMMMVYKQGKQNENKSSK